MPLSLDEIERRYLRYLLTTGKSPATIANYRRFFGNLRDVADERDLVIDTDQLDTELVREFHHWLVTSPLKQPYRGSRQRSPGGIFLQMELTKRLCAWLHEDGHVTQPVRVKLPKVLFRRRRALTAKELDRLLSYPYLDGHAKLRPTNKTSDATGIFGQLPSRLLALYYPVPA